MSKTLGKYYCVDAEYPNYLCMNPKSWPHLGLIPTSTGILATDDLPVPSLAIVLICEVQSFNLLGLNHDHPEISTHHRIM